MVNEIQTGDKHFALSDMVALSTYQLLLKQWLYHWNLPWSTLHLTKANSVKKKKKVKTRKFKRQKQQEDNWVGIVLLQGCVILGVRDKNNMHVKFCGSKTLTLLTMNWSIDMRRSNNIGGILLLKGQNALQDHKQAFQTHPV